VVSSVIDYLFRRDGARVRPLSAGGRGDDPPPARLGRYEIRECVGRGSFGTVYRAFDPVLAREVAVKTCEAPDQAVRARFEREARLAASLRHPNIVTIHDLAQEDGTLFLVQELLDGEDLDQAIERREEFSVPCRLGILRDISAGLAHAHEQGVIHRDIKPANVRRLEDGTAKILDFGIARRKESPNLTRPGLTVGSAAYMSPEQLRGDPVDVRTDVFSFGALAFELMTYRRAFPGDRISDVFDAIEKGSTEPLSDFCADPPAGLDAIIGRCLAKDREERFRDGGQLHAALAAIAPDESGTPLA
jgi:serine/threonine-protein kinase